jgi:succinyl-diaminopimelate desuccinylase
MDERITLRGALSVTRLAAGGRGGAVPARSAAWIDLRLPPRADPAHVLPRARRLLHGLAPRGTTVRLRVAAGTPGLETTPDAATRRAAEEACAAGFGRPPVYVRSGGTIPAAGMMARAFGIRPLLLGFGTPGGHAHGPDEAMDLPGWAAAVDTSVALLAALGRPTCPDRASARPRNHRRKGSQPVRCGAPLARADGEE